MKTRQTVIMLWIALQLGYIALPQASAQSVPPPANTASGAVKAGDSDLPGSTQQQELGEILKELREIRALLEKQQTQLADLAVNPRPSGKIEMNVESDWPGMGKMDAPVTVVEFTDLECPFCHQFEVNTFSILKRDYIDTGKVKFVSLDLPLSMHSYAEQAAEAAQCAADQGKFWELRTAFFHRSGPPTKSSALDSAKSFGLDLTQFQACLNTNKYRDKVEAEAKVAATLHIHATPTFVIGRVANGKLTGVELQGALSYSQFQSAVDNLLQDQQEAPPNSVAQRSNR
jgi:protein-disulfide isomerase